MGTYTTNKNLFMPTVGEQGWGELVNGNFSTIDTFLKPISLSESTYTFTGNHVGNQSGGSISATSITNDGTLTQTGTSTFTGTITANGGIGTKALTTTSISNSGTLTQTGTSTFTGKITANGGVNNYEERIATLEAGTFTYLSPFILKVKFANAASAWRTTYSIPSIKKQGGGNSTTTWTFTPLSNRWLTDNNLLYKLYLDESSSTTCTITISCNNYRASSVVFNGTTVASTLQSSSCTVSNVNIFSSHTLKWNNDANTGSTITVTFNTGGYISSQV